MPRKEVVTPPAELETRAGDVPLTPDNKPLFLGLSLFKQLKSPPNTDKFPGMIALRLFRRGEVICRQGEAGWTAFYILTAADVEKLPAECHAGLHEPTAGPAGGPAVTVHLAVAGPARAEKRRRLPWPFGGRRGGRAVAEGRGRPRSIPIDAPAPVSGRTGQAALRAGDLFGEMSCIYHRPRSATVVAERDCYVLEMLRNVLDQIRRDANFKARTDKDYRDRVLEAHLRGLSIFSDMTDEELQRLRDRVELVRYKHGDLICKQNDPSDCMYVIRAGVVKVVQKAASQPGTEAVVAYRAQGEFIGEMGLMLRQPRSATCVAYVHPLPGATDAAAERWRREAEPVELVKIKAEDFWELIKTSTAIHDKLGKVVADRKAQDERRNEAPVWEEGVPAQQMGRFEKLGLIQGQKLMLIDLDRCTRCDECVQACASTHDDGRARLFLDGERIGKYLVPTTCRSCRDPVCMIGCPVGSIHRGDNREIVIEDWCIGCELCAKNCPYGSIQMHDLGVVPNGAPGWRHRAAAGLEGDASARPNYPDRAWAAGQAPFYDFQFVPRDAAAAAVCFRYAFTLTDGALRGSEKFKLTLDTADAAAVVWINGQLPPPEKWVVRREDRSLVLEGEHKALLRPGRNVVAVRVTPGAAAAGKVLVDLALDRVLASDAIITHLAVVCDLCSGSRGQSPACVDACPHDAALRVDALTAFPVR